MVRLIILRLLILSWVIPLAYVLLLPLRYLFSGNIHEELNDINGFVRWLWKGNIQPS